MPFLDENFQFERVPETPSTILPEQHSPGVFKPLPTIELFKSLDIPSTQQDPKYSQTGEAFDWNQIIASTRGEVDAAQPKGFMFPIGELYENKRFPVYDPTIDNMEDAMGQAQSSGEKIVNGLVKFMGTTATTFVAGTLGTLVGMEEVLRTQKLSSFYDNPLAKRLDDISSSLEDSYAHYKTARQQNASWYEYDNITSMNFLMDGIIKNLGFSLGAFGAGFAWSSALKAIGLTGRAVALEAELASKAAAGESAVLEANNIIATGALEGGGLPAINGKLSLLTRGKIIGGKVLGYNNQNVVNTFATLTESGLEGFQAAKQYRENEIKKIKDSGREITAEDLKDINAKADTVGNVVLGINSIILGINNNFQLPKIFSSSFKGDRHVLTNTAFKDGFIQSILPEKGFAKSAYQTAKVAGLTFSKSEAYEEGAQFAAGTGTKHYYERLDKAEAERNFLDDGLLYGIREALFSEEGQENIFIGGVSGAMQMSGIVGINSKTGLPTVGSTGAIGRRGWTGYGGEEAKVREAALKEFKEISLNNKLKEAYAGIKVSAEIQGERENELLLGNEFEAKNLEYDYAHTYAISRIKYGAKELLDDEIQYVKQQASSTEGFDALKQMGVAGALDTQATFLKRIDSFQKHADLISKERELLNSKYGNMALPDGSRMYTDKSIDALVYTSGKIADINNRILQVSTELSTSGIDLFAIEQESKLDKSDLLKEEITKIKNNDALTIDEKETLIKTLTDYVRLNKSKRESIKEYNEIVDKPEIYSPKNKESVKDTTKETGKKPTPIEIKANKLTKTSKSETQKIIPGEEYYAGEVVKGVDKNGDEIPGVERFTVVGENEDGTIKIKDANGERDITKEYLESLKVESVKEATSTKKGKYFIEHIDHAFTYNLGKNRGGIVTGVLRYSTKKDILIFEYKNSRGKTIQKEVKEDMFKAKAPFKVAQVVAIGPRTPQQIKSEEELLLEAEQNRAQTVENRLGAMNSLITELQEKREKSKKLIAQKTAAITKAKAKIEKLQKTTAESKTKGGEKVQFTEAAMAAYSSAITLSTTIRQLEEELLVLQDDIVEINMTIDYVESYKDNIEKLPVEDKELLKQIKEEIEDLKELSRETVRQYNIVEALINKIKGALQTARDILKDLISKLGKANPGIPTEDIFGEDIYFDEDQMEDMLNDIPLFPEQKPSKELIEQVTNEQTAETITPKEAKIAELNEELEGIMETLKQVDYSLIAMDAILAKFKEVQAQARAHAKVVASMHKKGGAYDQLLATQTPDIDTSDTHEAFEADYKKEKTNVVIGTIAPSGETGGGPTGKYASRIQRFGNRFNEIEKTVKIRGIRVTHNTENQILPGLMAHLHPKVSVKELQKMVVIVVTNDKGELLDEFGKVIPKNTSDEEKLERAIYQVTPDSVAVFKEEENGKVTLEGKVLSQYYSGGYESMFRKDVPLAEQIRLTKLYFAKKNSILKQKTLDKPVMIGASFGLLEYETLIGENGEPIINDKGKTAKNFKLRTSVVDANLIEDKTIQNTPSIIVSTKQGRVTNGSVSFMARTGLVFLKVPNGLARLFNRKFTDTEGAVISDVLAQLAHNIETDGDIKSPNTVRLLEYLKSTVYWGISHHKITGKAKDPGKNSVWFETDRETKVMTLFVGSKENAFEFTSVNIKNNKQNITSILTGMHNNTHNAFLQKERIKVKYRQITGIDEKGNILDVTWPNYQTYLLSNKKHDAKGKLTVERPSSEIPLTNNARPVKGTEDFNRKGIYFTVLDDLAYYATGKPTKKVPTAKDVVEVAPPVLDGATPNIVTLNTKVGDVAYILNEDIAAKLLKAYKVDIFAKGNSELLNDFIIKLIKAKGLNVIIPDENLEKYFSIEIKIGEDVSTIKTEREAEVYAAKQVVYKIRPILSQHLYAVNTKVPVKKEAPTKAPTPVKAPVKSATGINTSGTPNTFNGKYGEVTYTFFIDAALEILEKRPELLESPAQLSNALRYAGAIVIPVSDEHIQAVSKVYPQLPEELKEAVVAGEIVSHITPLLLEKFLEANKPVESTETATEEDEAKAKALAEFNSGEILEAPAEEMDPDEEVPFKLAPDGTPYPVDRPETWTKVEAMLHKMAPGLAVYRVRNMIKATNGRQAFGMFRKAAIYIAQGAPAGTAYHEVFEAVWHSVTDRAEKVEILNEFRERPGYFKEHDTQKKIYYAEATDAELKEEIAEEFSKYILNLEESKPTTWIGKLFKAIKDILHTFFIGKEALNNTETLFKLIGDGYYAKYLVNEEGLSLAEKGIQDIEDAEGDEFSVYKIAGLTTMQEHDILQEMTYSIYNILNKTSKDMLASTDNIDNAVYTQVYNDIVAILRKEAAVADNPEDIQNLFYIIKSNWANLKAQHRIMLRPFDITFDEETEEITMGEENASKIDSYNSNKIDTYKRINSVVKFMFATIPDNSRQSTIGGHVFVDSSRVFISLMNELYTSVDMGEMMARLEVLSNVNPYFAEIYTRMTKLIPNQGMTIDLDTMTQEDMTVISGFWHAFKKQNPGVLIVYKQENGEVAVGDTNLSSAAKQARYDMTQNIIASIKEGNAYFTYSKKNKTFSPTKALMKLNTEGNSLDGRDISNYTNFLDELGINFEPMAVLQSGRKDEFIEAVDGLILSLKESVGIEVLTPKTIDANNNLAILGEIQAVITHPMYESTFYSIDGEKTQTFIGTNHFSDVYDILSSIDNLAELAGTPLAYLLTDKFSTNINVTYEYEAVIGSLIINRMFDSETGDRLPDSKDIMKPVYTGGTIDMEKERRISSDMLNPRQRLEQSINLALKGIYGVLVPGDSELEHGVRLHGKEDPFVTVDDIIHNNHLHIFRDYFINEVRLSRDNRIVSGKRDNEDLRFFKDMLASDPALHFMITSIDTDVSPQQIYEDNHVRINAALEKFFEKEMQETKAELIDYDLISKTADGYTTDLGYDERKMSNEVMDLELKALTMNYIIANIELFKVLYSDPYQYSDLLKRIKNFLSPRVPMMDSQETNMMLHEVYNRDFEEGSLGWTDMTKNFFRTAVIADVDALQDLDNYNKEADSYIETDGGGYITLKAIRLFKLKTASWTGRNELQYKHDIKFEELAKAIINSKNETQRAEAKTALIEHEKNNPGVADTYTPIKPIVAGSKANGRDYNDVMLDKYALLPISYRLIYNMNPESNMLKLYNKMSEEDVDYVVYESGRKVGVEKRFPLYDKDGNFNNAPFQSQEERDEIEQEGVNVRQSIINVLHFNMGLQAEVPSKEGSSVTQGSQSTKLVYMDFRAGGVPIDYNSEELKDLSYEQRFLSWMRLSEEEKRNASKIYTELENNKEILEERVKDGFDNVLDLLGFKEVEINGERGFEIESREKLIKTLQDELFKQAVNINVIDSLREYKNNDIILESTPVYQQVRNILYSIARSNITRPKVTGGMKVQIPSTLFESTTRPIKHVSKKGTVYYGSDFLKFYTKGETNPETGEVAETNVAEIMVKRWFKSPLTDEQLLDSWYVVKDGKRTTELTPEGKEILSVFAFRTPTQKQNSMEAYVIKGFLPQEYGDSVMVPAAMIKKSGSDFDIDKLSLYFKNLYRDAVGKLKIVPFYGYGEQAKKRFEDLFYEIVGEKIKKTEAIRINNEEQKKAFLAIARGTAPEHIKKKWQPILEKTFEKKLGQEFTLADIGKMFNDVASKVNKRLIDLTDYDLQQHDAKEFVKNKYTQSLENAYTTSLYNLTVSEHNFENLVKPNSAEELKELSKDINKLKGIEEIDFLSLGFMLSLTKMTNLRGDFIRGKKGIAIAATSQTNHSLNQSSLIVLNPESLKNSKIRPEDKVYLGDLTIRFAPDKYNSVNLKELGLSEEDKFVATLSKSKSADKKSFISDIIGMFIDGYVDISKGPWIMQMKAIPSIAGTWLYLIKIGVPIRDVAMFINQPMIQSFLKGLENKGASYLFNNLELQAIQTKYKITNEEIKRIKEIPELSTLEDNIKKGLSEMGHEELIEQVFMLKEFLKYSKMAEHLLSVQRGTDFDTAYLNDSFLIFQKEELLNLAQNSVFSAIEVNQESGNTEFVSYPDAILNNTFIGILRDKLLNIKKAYSEVLISSNSVLGPILDKVLLPYIKLSPREFVQVSNKAVSSFFDWATQTNEGFNLQLKTIMLGNESEESAARQIIAFRDTVFGNPKKGIPENINHALYNNLVLRDMQLIAGSKPGVPDNIKIKNKDLRSYDQNLIINSLEEIKIYFDNMGSMEIYEKIVSLAVLQSGLTNSPIAFSKLLPFEDFKEVYYNTLNNISNIPELDAFADILALERNEWSDSSIVNRVERRKRSIGGMVTIPTWQKVPFSLSKAFNDKKIPRVIFVLVSDRNASEVILHTWSDTISWAERKKKARIGNTDHLNKLLMRKVYLDKENNIPYEYITDDGEKGFLYVAINGWGDSFRAKEYYRAKAIFKDNIPVLAPPSSVFTNGLLRLSAPEVSDDVILGLLNKGNIVDQEDSSVSVLGSSTKKGFKLPVSYDKLKKDQGKADLANRFIGYGLPGTATHAYEVAAIEQNIPINYEGTYDENTVAFVSVNGNNKASAEAIDETIENAREILENGGTVVMDSTYHANSKWNINGEGEVQEGLGTPTGVTLKGYNYWGPNPEQVPVKPRTSTKNNKVEPWDISAKDDINDPFSENKPTEKDKNNCK